MTDGVVGRLYFLHLDDFDIAMRFPVLRKFSISTLIEAWSRCGFLGFEYGVCVRPSGDEDKIWRFGVVLE